MMTLITFEATLIQGHRVASGLARDSRFPNGTLILQQPLFMQRGLDTSNYYLGTLNLDTSPHIVQIKRPMYTYHHLKWHPEMPAESFSFAPCILQRLSGEGGDSNGKVDHLEYGKNYPSLIYHPHIETKTEHHKIATVVEVLSPYIANLNYGSIFSLSIDSQYL